MRSSPDQRLWVVILAGGIGSRFWPASTPRRPKQLLRLTSERPLIRETVDRVEPLVGLDRLRILTGSSLVEPIRTAVPELGPSNFLVEPRAAGTAPVLTWAAHRIASADSDAVMVSVHADHVIQPASLFRQQIATAARLAAEHGHLFTLGAVPTRPETGFGYIRVGSPLADPAHGSEAGGFRVDRFVEKPDHDRATAYLAEGGYLWNTGLFVWRAADLLREVERHSPEIAPLLPLLAAGDEPAFFERVPPISIDEAVLERSDRVAVLPAEFGWDDIGAWDSMFRTHPRDERGNVLVGDAFAVDSEGCALYADDGPVVAFGASDLIVVRAAGVTFVTHRDRSADLKKLLEALPDRLRIPEG